VSTFGELSALLARVEGILGRIEAVLPPAPPPPDWHAHAFRWRKRAGRGYLQAVRHPHVIRLDDLVAIDEQKRAIDANTRQFVAGLPANNVLLTGSRGTGKSSLVKAMLVKYSAKGLRLIEVDKGDLIDLPDIADQVEGRRERFIVFCDDLTFDAGEPGYKALKVMLDGTIAAASANMLIYATSNRRHLLPEYFSENLETKHIGEEVHPANRSRKRFRCPSGSDSGFRSIHSARTITSPPSPRGWIRSALPRRNPHATRRCALGMRCNSRCSAVRAAVESRGSSPKATPVPRR
jgi:predicted AAA+ superfamily ATPase